MRRLGLLLGAWVGVQVLLGVLSSLLQWLGLVAAAETAWGLGLGVGLLPLVGLVVVLVRGLCWLGWLLRLEPGARRQVWWLRRLRRGWPELAQSLGLVARSGRDGRVLWPGMRAWPDAWGAVLELGTPPGVGRRELAARAQHLADQWGCVRVAVEQAAPGRLRLRALRWGAAATAGAALGPAAHPHPALAHAGPAGGAGLVGAGPGRVGPAGAAAAGRGAGGGGGGPARQRQDLALERPGG